MRTTASYELFPDAPSERAMARARYLVREGRIADAEKAYRNLLAEHPDLKPGWAECFELLRAQGRGEDALRVAEGARAQFGDSAFSLALKGAALTDLERYREALATLEQAVEFDPDLALVWHELGYAAFRLGDRNRALLALDRAFALEPHPALVRRDRDGGTRLRRRHGGPRRFKSRRRVRRPGAGFPVALRPDRRARACPAGVAHHGGRAGSTARHAHRVRSGCLPAGGGPAPSTRGRGLVHPDYRRRGARDRARVRARAPPGTSRHRRRRDRRARRRRRATHPPDKRRPRA